MGRTNCCEKNGACYNSANRTENRLTLRSRKISFAHKIQFNRRTLLKLYTDHDNMTRCWISDVSVDEKDRTKWDLVIFEFTICLGRNVMGSLRTVVVKLPLTFEVYIICEKVWSHGSQFFTHQQTFYWGIIMCRPPVNVVCWIIVVLTGLILDEMSYRAASPFLCCTPMYSENIGQYNLIHWARKK